MSATGILGMFWSEYAVSLGGGLQATGGGRGGSNSQLFCMTESSSLLMVPVDHTVIDQCCIPEGAKAPPLSRQTGAGGGGGVGFRDGKLRAPPRLPLKGLKKGPSEPTMVKRESIVRGWQFWDHLHAGVLKLEDQVLRGHAQGLGIGRIDQYARQISLTLMFKDALGTDIAENAASMRDRSISLIIRFPSNSEPSFALRGLEGRSEQAAGATLTSKLGSIARGYASGDASQGADFLVEVATCFRATLISQIAAHLSGGAGIESPPCETKIPWPCSACEVPFSRSYDRKN